MKKQSNSSTAGRKLCLNKKTISNLNSSEMACKMGGGSGYFQTCGNTCHGTGGGGNSKNCTKNQNTCPGHNTCYTC